MRESTLASAARILFLASIALLPWGKFPPFPWLHENAQWSDAVFALAAVCWLSDRLHGRRWSSPAPLHLAMAGYLVAGGISLLLTRSGLQPGGTKLLGTAELCLIAVITSELAADARVRPGLVRVIAVTGIVIAVFSITGLLLFYLGYHTTLIAAYGEHLAGSKFYARSRFFTSGPNLLGSFCVFASSALALDASGIHPRVRRAAQVALAVTVALTLSYEILSFTLAWSIRHAGTKAGWKAVLAMAAVFASGVLLLTVANPKIDLTDPSASELRTEEPSGRWRTAATSLQTIRANPLWGSGPGQPPGTYRGRPYDAHMTVLNVAGTMGIPALACFLSVFVILWRQRRRPTDPVVWAPFAAFALSSLVCDVEDFRHLWVMIGIADADRNLSQSGGRGV